MDKFKSVLSGLGSGVTGLAGLPGLAQDAVTAGMDWVAPPNQKQLQARAAAPDLLPSPATTKAAAEKVTGKFYKPQSTLGEYLHTGAEFIPGSLLAPGGVVGNAIRYGALPGFASEAAGQATKGSEYEGLARVAGGLAGAGATSLTVRPRTSSQSIRNQLPDDITAAHVDEAERLMQDAAQRGITLQWPEALSQVAGRPVLSDVMRHLEAAPQTSGRMNALYADRPQQVDYASRAAMDRIAPPSQAPSSIGREVGTAAEETLQGVRQTINDVAEPHYTRARGDWVDPATMGRVRATPEWQAARDAVRNDTQLNRNIRLLPENSVGFLNAVKKYLDTAAANAGSPLNAQRSVERSAGLGADAAAVRRAGVYASPSYETALHLETYGRGQILQPLLDGPLGKLAANDPTTKNAIKAMFPSNPIPNSAQEISTAMNALVRRNPNASRDLVRAHAEATFNEATQALQTGANQAGGAKFAAQLVGNSQQRANL